MSERPCTADDVNFELIACLLRNCREACEFYVVERTLHDDVELAYERLSMNLAANFPYKRLGMLISVQLTELYHLGIQWVFFPILGQVQANVTVVSL
ncbi:hypothetical protein D3C76_1323490 [compost metagenome]